MQKKLSSSDLLLATFWISPEFHKSFNNKYDYFHIDIENHTLRANVSFTVFYAPLERNHS